jgi:uncharacterized protein (TIGR03663 family)
MSKSSFRLAVLAALIAAAALRFDRLDRRPMHHDEANQAVKLGALLETGDYVYDKADHHGPTLYYLTLPAAWARGQRTLAALDETTLRAVPALFGLGLVALLLLLTRAIGRGATAGAMVLAAVSPALTYYSRSYIQEMLFAFFAWGFLIALGRLFTKPSGWSAVAAGTAAGMAFASKETSVLVFAAAAAGIAAAWLWTKPEPESSRRLPRPVHALTGLAAAAGTAFLFYSSFFRHPAGIFDSLTAFGDYAARGTEAGLHSQPWFYYLKTLAWTRAQGVSWTEGLILGLALIGIAAAVIGGKRRPKDGPADAQDPSPRWARVFWLRYLAISTVLLAGMFSALSYKTPWNMVVFQAGFALLGGIGADALLRLARPQAARLALAAVLLLGVLHLGRQSLLANQVYPADPRNPYVYAQTSPDFLRLADRIKDLAGFHRQGKAMPIKVLAEPSQQWPLPWYLRDFTAVGYGSDEAAAGSLEGFPVVIASQAFAESVETAAGEAYQPSHYGLRPEVVLTLFVERTLWEDFLSSRIRR